MEESRIRALIEESLDPADAAEIAGRARRIAVSLELGLFHRAA